MSLAGWAAAGPGALATDPDSPPDPPLDEPQRASTWGEGSGKSYLIPALDIIGFDFLLNRADNAFSGDDAYDVSFQTFKDNLHRGWVIDSDPFATNQFLHPYQGSMYHGFGRSAGLAYWQSLIYDFFGSAFWETAGETTPPSLNDQITTTFAGSFLGEALFRMSGRVLEGGGDRPSGLRSFGAAAISPPTGFNRFVFGKRFDGVFDSRDPASCVIVGLGVRRNARATDLGVLSDIAEDGAIASFSMDYGLPGKPDYTYERPFDYFHFDVIATSSAHALPENVATRGLLYGSNYEGGDALRGVWGLYGTYDYLAPEVFNLSSTALSLGTTGQWWLSKSIALQGTGMAGVGWTAIGSRADAQTDRDYYYGGSLQAFLALRLTLGQVAMIDLNGREFHVRGRGSVATAGTEDVLRGQLSLTARIHGGHAVMVQFVGSARNATFTDLPDTLQTVGALSLMYTYVSDKRFGAVPWGEYGR